MKFQKIAQPLKSAFWLPKKLNLTTNESLRRNGLFGALTANWAARFTNNIDVCAKNSSYIANEHVFTELSDEKVLSALKYYIWFFYFDDQFDDMLDNDFCESQAEILSNIIKTGVNTEKKGEYFAVDMFHDFYKDIFKQNNVDINNQFLVDVESYLGGLKCMNGIKNKTKNKKSNKHTNKNRACTHFRLQSDEYLQIRESDIGLMSLLSIMYQLYPEFNDTFKKPSVVSLINENEIMNEMKSLCCKHAVLVNDILGFNKDIEENTGLNFIMLQHEEKYPQSPLQDTVNHTIDFCNDLFRQSHRLEKELKSTSFYHSYSKPIDRWIHTYHAFISYHINWYYVAERYTNCNK